MSESTCLKLAFAFLWKLGSMRTLPDCRWYGKKQSLSPGPNKRKEKGNKASPPAPPRRGRGVKSLGNRKQIEYNWKTYHSPPSSGRGRGRGSFMASMTPFLSSCCATPFIMHCILTQITPLFEADCVMIWGCLGANLMQIAWIFTVNTGRYLNAIL